MAKHIITLIPGDGIGVEVIAAGLQVLDQHAGQVGHAVLGQQQLELFVATQGVGRTHECRQGFALLGQAGLEARNQPPETLPLNELPVLHP